MSKYVSGYSYPHTGSIAYPLRTRLRRAPKQDMLLVVLDLVHPGNLGPLPPSPRCIAYKGEQIGLARYEEFFEEIWY